LNLQAIVSQRLVPGLQARQVPAVEVMLRSPLIADLIQAGRVDEIRPVMARSNDLGMTTFDQSLYLLYVAGQVSLEQALLNADSKTDLKLRIKLSKPRDAVLSAPELRDTSLASLGEVLAR
jgi:twitching motility protein PilU